MIISDTAISQFTLEQSTFRNLLGQIQYAMADKEDDLRIGVKSTAIFFAEYDRFIILLLQILFHTIWLYLAFTLHSSGWFYGCWFVAIVILVYQQQLLSQRDATASFAAFSTNIWYGLLMWGALL